jgi:hypothetical protein
MTRSIIILHCMLLVTGLIGCVSAHETMLTGEKRAPLRPEEVQIYLTEKDVLGAYEKVALIHLDGDTSWTNEKGMWNAAKKKAAKLGANGLIIGDVKEPSSGSKVAGAVFGVPVSRKSQGLAIYVPGARF